MKRKPRTMAMATVAKALDVSTKTLQRWRARRWAPFDSDGRCEVEEVRAWAAGEGLLGREAHRPLAIETLALGSTASAPSQTAPAAPAAVDLPRLTANELRELTDKLTAEDREVIQALVDGDTEKLMALVALGKLTVDRLKLAALIGRARKELGDAVRREIENEVTRKNLIPADEVHRFWGRQVDVVKAYLTAMPGKLAGRLVKQDYEAIYQALEDEAQAIQESLAKEALT